METLNNISNIEDKDSGGKLQIGNISLSLSDKSVKTICDTLTTSFGLSAGAKLSTSLPTPTSKGLALGGSATLGHLINAGVKYLSDSQDIIDNPVSSSTDNTPPSANSISGGFINSPLEVEKSLFLAIKLLDVVIGINYVGLFFIILLTFSLLIMYIDLDKIANKYTSLNEDKDHNNYTEKNNKITKSESKLELESKNQSSSINNNFYFKFNQILYKYFKNILNG